MNSLPMKGQAWRTARGCLGIWLPSPLLLVVVMRGYGEAAFSDLVIAAHGRLSAVLPIHVFVDAGDLVNYDSQLRLALTARFMLDRARLATCCILVHSKLVAMGVTVANLAWGGKITTHTSERTFSAALDNMLFDLRIVGFSSQALASVTRAPADSGSG